MVIKNHSMLERISSEDRAKSRFNVEFLDSIGTSVGHIFSVLVEELGDENPNLPSMIFELNKYISVGGNGFARVESLNDTIVYGCKRFMGLGRYLRFLGLPKPSYDRIMDETRGIIPEDRIFENFE